MRKLAALLLALALLAPGALAESDFPVYQVRAPGSSATVYLFPSIHAADERAYPLSQISQDAHTFFIPHIPPHPISMIAAGKPANAKTVIEPALPAGFICSYQCSGQWSS